MKRTLYVFSVLLAGLLLPHLSSAAYDLSWQTVDGGGSQSTSSPYTLTGAVGQPDAGAASGGDYALHGGFWVMTAYINVKRGTTTLPDGTGTYNFGSVTLGSSSATITFTIENTGLALLGVSSIQKSGSHPNDFTVTQAASATVAPRSSTTFTVKFTPTATGTRTATISIINSDNANDRNPYTFSVTGTGVASSGNSYLLWTK